MDLVINELEIASLSVVHDSARNFAAALSETPQFKEYDEFSILLRQDESAQQAIHAYEEKEQSLQALLMH